MSKKALVVGKGGQDGVLLSQLLVKRGYSEDGIGRNDLDILNPKKVIEFMADMQPNEVYYLAAYHHSSENLPSCVGEIFRESMNVHFYGLVNFLDAMLLVCPESRLFFASSSHVFAADEVGMQTEETGYNPQSEYAITKVAGMRACEHYRRVHKLFACSGILFNHESPLRKPFFLSKKIALAVASIAKNGSGTLELGDLEAQVDWGDAHDYVDAMNRILQLDKPSDYIISTGILHTVRDFVEIAFGYVGLDYRDHVVSKPNEALRKNGRRVGDFTKLKEATGWVPRTSFREMVHKLVQFEMDAHAADAL